MSVKDDIQMESVSSSSCEAEEQTEQISKLVEEEIIPTTLDQSSLSSTASSAPVNNTTTLSETMAKQTTHTVKNLSLRGLKNLIFGSSTYSEANWSHQPLIGDEEAGSRSLSRDIESDSDSQTTLKDQREEVTANGSGYQFDKKQCIRDVTIGLADGLTVPFALTAGLSALGKTDVVVAGGLAELFAGAISMGLGGYMAEKSAV